MRTKSMFAPKYLIRYSSDLQRDSVALAAEESNLSINTFILQAIDEKLGRGIALDHVIEMAKKHMTAADELEDVLEGLVGEVTRLNKK